MILMIGTREVLYDEIDQPIIDSLKWHIGSTGYAVWRGIKDGKKMTIRLHRLIARTPDNMITDHINHNKLDNRRDNLRVCTSSDNMRNLTNQGKGYWYQKQNNNWVVEIYGIHRGCFDTEQEAAEFADLVRKGLSDKKPKIIRTVCKYGHSLEDFYDYGHGKQCRKCQRERSAEWYKRKQERLKQSRHLLNA